jgi:hypothetical protein
VNGRIACGSMEFSTLPEAITPAKRGIGLYLISIDRFAFFAHFAAFVVQTPTL